MWREKLTKDRAAGIIIERDRVLLIHRLNEGREYWTLPGGSFEEGETPEEVVTREIKEELSFEVLEKKLLFIVEAEGRKAYHFLISKYSGELKLGEPEASRQSETNKYIFEWLSLPEIISLENFFPKEASEKFISLWRENKLKDFLEENDK